MIDNLPMRRAKRAVRRLLRKHGPMTYAQLRKGVDDQPRPTMLTPALDELVIGGFVTYENGVYAMRVIDR